MNSTPDSRHGDDVAARLAAADQIIDAELARADRALSLPLADALLAKGTVLTEAGRDEEALTCYQFLAEHADVGQREQRRKLIRALPRMGSVLLALDRWDAARATFDSWCDLASYNADPTAALGRMRRDVVKRYAQRLAGAMREARFEDAIRVADELSVRAAGAENSAMSALASVATGQALVELARPAAAIQTFGDVIERYSSGRELPVEQQVATAMYLRARALTMLDRDADALAQTAVLQDRFGEHPDAKIHSRVTAGLKHRAFLLRRTERDDDARKAVDDIIDRSAAESSDRQKAEVETFLTQADLQRRAGRSQTAVAILDEYIAHKDATAGSKTDPTNLCRVLSTKAEILNGVGRIDDAIAVVHELLECATSASTVSSVHWMETGLLQLAEYLRVAGRVQDALAATETLLQRFDSGIDPPSDHVTTALSDRAALLALAGDFNAAAIAADTLLARIGAGVEERYLTWRAAALAMKGGALVEAGKPERALDALEALRREPLSGADGVELRGYVALGLHNMIRALAQVGRDGDALAIQTELIEGSPEDAVEMFERLAGQIREVDAPSARRQLAGILFRRAWTLRGLGRDSEALSVLDELIGRLEKNSDPLIQETVRSGYQLRQEIQNPAVDG